MAQTHGAPALTFHKTTFTIIDRTDGQIWLRGPQIADALGFANTRHLNDLFKSNLAEFTPSMTALVKMDTAGGPQDVRIFSLRGAHLLGMFSRTDRSGEFRRWVLDVLEQQGRPALPAPGAAELARVTAERDALRHQLRETVLSQHPHYRQMLKYMGVPGLNQEERARLMGWSSSNTWRYHLLQMAKLGLVDYTPDPRAGAQKLIAHTAALRAQKAATATEGAAP